MKQVETKLSARLILSVLAIGLLGFTDIMLETALNVSFPILMTTFNVKYGPVVNFRCHLAYQYGGHLVTLAEKAVHES